MSKNYLNEERKQIDAIDAEILELLYKRFALMPKIAKLKALNNTPIHQPEREQKVIERRKEYSLKTGLDEKFVERLFKLVFEESKRIQEESLNRNCF